VGVYAMTAPSAEPEIVPQQTLVDSACLLDRQGYGTLDAGPAWVEVGRADELPEGGRKLIKVSGVEIALFRLKGKVYALSNRCPHRGGPLIRGYLEGCGIRCPMHGWRFDLHTGESQQPARARTYAVRSAGGMLHLAIL